MHHSTKITADQLKDCVSKGMRDEEIAAQFGATTIGIRNKRNRLKLPPGRRLATGPAVAFTNEQLVARIGEGWSDERIGLEYSCHPHYVGQRRRRIGILVEGNRQSLDRELRRLVAQGFQAEEIGRKLRVWGRPFNPHTIARACERLGIRLAHAIPNEDEDEPPEITRAALERAEAKMAAAMAGHHHESLTIKSHGTPKVPRPITHVERASSSADAVA